MCVCDELNITISTDNMDSITIVIDTDPYTALTHFDNKKAIWPV